MKLDEKNITKFADHQQLTKFGEKFVTKFGDHQICHQTTLDSYMDVTYVKHATWQKIGKWGIPEKSIKNVAGGI